MGAYINELELINNKLEKLKKLISVIDYERQEIEVLIKVLEEKEPEYKSFSTEFRKNIEDYEKVQLLVQESEKSKEELWKSMILSEDVDYSLYQVSKKMRDSIKIKYY